MGAFVGYSASNPNEKYNLDYLSNELSSVDKLQADEAKGVIEENLDLLAEISSGADKDSRDPYVQNKVALQIMKTALVISKIDKTERSKYLKDTRYQNVLLDYSILSTLRSLFNVNADKSWLDIVSSNHTQSADEYRDAAVCIYGYAVVLNQIYATDIYEEVPSEVQTVQEPSQQIINISKRDTGLGVSRAWSDGNEYLDKAKEVLLTSENDYLERKKRKSRTSGDDVFEEYR